MTSGRRLGGAPRWLIGYVAICLVTLLLAATILYVTTVQTSVAVAQLPREGSVARRIHGVPYADLINETAGNHQLNPALVAAVVAAESGFNAQARSARGAHGLMQVMPATWREFAVRPAACAPEIARLTMPPCMDDPRANLETGSAYLQRLVSRFKGDLPLALAAYNAGAGVVEHHEGVPPFPETSRYLRQVALAWFHLQREGTLTPLWRSLLRSAPLVTYARLALVLAVAGLAAPLVRYAQRSPAIPIRQAVRR